MDILFNVLPKLALTLRRDSFGGRHILLLKFWYFAVTRKSFLRGKPMKFNLRYFKKNFSIYIESIVDIAVLAEVFILEEYSWSPIVDPKIIIDLGAHFGDTSLYYHLKYPNAHILAVEPAPETFKRLCLNVQHISNITPIQAGVSNRDGFADLNIVPSSLGNSFKVRTDMQSTISVPVHTLQTLLRMCNTKRADIIKFDIEGAEELLFTEDDPQLFADAYIGEVHGDLMSISPESFISKFKDFSIGKEALSNPDRFILKAIKKYND